MPKILPSISKIAIFVGSLSLLNGCAGYSLKMHPALNMDENQKAFIPCNIVYEGNSKYLPSNLRESDTSKCKAHYTYGIRDVNSSANRGKLNAFNPLRLVGFFTNNENIVVEGNLSFDDGIGKPTVLTSSCTATKKLSLYGNSEKSDPKNECLNAVRDNINTQLVQYKQNEK